MMGMDHLKRPNIYDGASWLQGLISFLLSIIMSLDHTIIEVGADRQDSEGFARLDESFFLSLHSTEIKYIKLKYGRKNKETEKELSKVIMELVASYTDCIDYFGESGDAAAVYFQIKIKEINKYFQFLNSQITYSPQSNLGVPSDNPKDLGSISEQTGPQLLPAEEREVNAAGKQALNHNLMVYLQNQDIKSHIQERLKKQEKISNAITDSLKRQEDILTKRKRNRKNASKSRIFLSFSQRNLDISRSSDNSEMIMVDLEALEANSPEELKAMARRLDQQSYREGPIVENLLQRIMEDD